jgi:hypothetical protein
VYQGCAQVLEESWKEEKVMSGGCVVRPKAAQEERLIQTFVVKGRECQDTNRSK